MATRGGDAENPQQPKVGRPLQIPKGSKRYRIDLGCSWQARDAYERWQKSLSGVDTNASLVHRVLDLLEKANQTLTRSTEDAGVQCEPSRSDEDAPPEDEESPCKKGSG